MRQNAINLKLKAQDLYSKTYAKFRKDNGVLRKDRKKDDKAVLKSRDIQKKYQSSLRDISGFNKQRDALKKHALAQNTAKEKFEGLKAQMMAAKNPTKRLTEQFENQKMKLSNLGAKYDVSKHKLNELKGSLHSAGINTNKLGEAKHKLNSKISALTPKINKETEAHNKQMGVIKRLNALKSKRDAGLQRGANMAIGGYGLLASGGAILRTLAKPIIQGANFEKSMSKVGALTGAKRGSADFATLQGNAEHLGATTAYSASQVADGQQYLAMAGFKPKAIAESMGGIINMSLASGLDMGSTADIGSDIMTGFGLTAKDMAHVGDVLVKTFTSSNTSLAMVGDTMKYIAPVAKNLGISMETAAAMTGILGNAGIKGSQAGTGLRAMMLKLAKPAKKGQQALDKLGIKTLDAAGNMRPMVKILEELDAKTKNLGSGVKQGIIKDLVGTEAATAMTVLLDQVKEIKKYATEIKNSDGISETIAGDMSNNFLGDYTKLQSATEAISISFTKVLNPALRATTQWFTGMASGLNGLMKKYPNVTKVVGAFAAILGTAMVVGGGLMVGMGGLAAAMAVTSWSSGVIGASRFGGALRFVGTAIKFVGRALLMNPIGLLVTAIAVGGYLIYKNWKPIKKFFIELWNNPKKKWNQFVNWVSDKFNNLWKPVKSAWGGVKNWAKGLWSGVTEKWASVTSWVKTNMPNTWNEVSKNWSVFKKFASQFWTSTKVAWNAFASLSSTLFSNIWSGVSPIWNIFKDYASKFWNGIKDTWNTFSKWIGSIFPNLFSGVSAPWNAIKTFASGLWDGVKDKWESAKKILSSFTLDDVGMTIIGGLKLAFEWNPITLIYKAFTGVRAWLSNFSLSNVGTNIISGLVTAFNWTPLGALVLNFDKVKTWLTNFDLSKAGNAIVNSLKSPFIAVFSWFDNKFTSFKSGLKGLLSFGGDVGKTLNNSPTQVAGKPRVNARTGMVYNEPAKRAFGGFIDGAGTSRSDSNLAFLSDREFIAQAPMATKSPNLLNGINSGKITELGLTKKLAAAAMVTSVIATPVAVAANQTPTQTISAPQISSTIHIHAAPGMNEQDLANMVNEKLQALLTADNNNLFDG